MFTPLNTATEFINPMHAGIVLCGGKSSRMGYPKAWLPFGAETLLARVARILAEVTEDLIVVAAPGQDLPPIGRPATIIRDAREGRGPLEAFHAGFAALPAKCEAAYVTSCDVPLLKPEFVEFMFAALGDWQAAVPVEEQFIHPLAAVYRASVLPVIEELLAAERMRPAYLFDRVATNRVSVKDLRRVDPELDSLTNLNRPADYFQALDVAGFECPTDVYEKLVSP